VIGPLLLIFAAYQLAWYGYATLRQPVPCGSNPSGNCGEGCCGFLDLLLPGNVAKVDKCISSGWSSGSNSSNNGTQAGAGQNPVYNPQMGVFEGGGSTGTIYTEPGAGGNGIYGPLGSKPL
jgi:hypothetical protein